MSFEFWSTSQNVLQILYFKIKSILFKKDDARKRWCTLPQPSKSILFGSKSILFGSILFGKSLLFAKRWYTLKSILFSEKYTFHPKSMLFQRWYTGPRVISDIDLIENRDWCCVGHMQPFNRVKKFYSLVAAKFLSKFICYNLDLGD